MFSKIEWLLKMIEENPDLPVIPMVSNEVFDDSSFKLISGNRWMGSIGDAEIQMYIQSEDGIVLYSDCNYVDMIAKYSNHSKDECQKMTDEELESEYDNLPWKKAIFLNIDWAEE